MIPIYYINREKDKNRNSFMNSQFKKFSIKAQRINAFVASDPIVDYLFTNKNCIHFRNCEYPNYPNVVACCLSHLKAIKTAYENKNSSCIILEDNVELKYFNQYYEKLEYFLNTNNSFDCINLLPTGPEKTLLHLYKLNKNNIKSIPHKSPCFGLKMAYYNSNALNFINEKFPEIDCETISKIKSHMHADLFIYSLLNSGISTFPFGNIALNFLTSIHKNPKIKHRVFTHNFIQSKYHDYE